VDLLDQQALEHLSHLPTLRELSLYIIPTLLSLSRNNVTPVFPVLRKLAISQTDIDGITRFFLCAVRYG
jgi:hypothetical protein